MCGRTSSTSNRTRVLYRHNDLQLAVRKYLFAHSVETIIFIASIDHQQNTIISCCHVANKVGTNIKCFS